MKLEEEIKQSKFKSEKIKLTVNLIYTGSWINSKMTGFLKPFGLTTQQFNVLRILNGQYPNPATVNLIIDRMLDKMSNVSRLIDKLLAKGYVERNLRGDDRRCVDILITGKGKNLLKEIDKVQADWEKNITGLTQKECKELNNLLDKLRD
jgi:DNA-binding MarR family transcriptional regulator